MWDQIDDIVKWVTSNPVESVGLAVLTSVLAFFAGFASNLRDLMWDRIEPRINRTLDACAAKRSAKKLASKNLKTQQAAQAELDHTRDNRVGRRFLFRAYPDDPGMIGEVIRLHNQHPGTKVIVQWSSQPGREPHEDDYSTDNPIGMEWRSLTRSPDYYKHWTARMLLKSHNDDDGWVMHEEIT